MRLCQGVGINDRKYPSKINGITKKEYKHWNAMLYRCYSPLALNRDATYIDCYVSDNFKKYSYFYEWCSNQIGFDEDGFELDKDILLKGNNIYSEETCVFLPHEINSILNSCKTVRGRLPLGITMIKQRYVARISKKNERVEIGRFGDLDAAFTAYKKAKEDHLKQVALEYRDRIDPRAYHALMNYSVEITD